MKNKDEVFVKHLCVTLSHIRKFRNQSSTPVNLEMHNN